MDIQCMVPEWFKEVNDWFVNGKLDPIEMSEALWWLVQNNIAKCVEIGTYV
jgi:hypothetical protein